MATPQQMLTNIANAIRGKTGKTATMTMPQMVTEINGISAMPNKMWQVDEKLKLYIYTTSSLGNVTQWSLNVNSSTYSDFATASGKFVFEALGGSSKATYTYYQVLPDAWFMRSGDTTGTTLKKITAGAIGSKYTSTDYKYYDMSKCYAYGITPNGDTRNITVEGYLSYQPSSTAQLSKIRLVPNNTDNKYYLQRISGPSYIYCHMQYSPSLYISNIYYG